MQNLHHSTEHKILTTPWHISDYYLFISCKAFFFVHESTVGVERTSIYANWAMRFLAMCKTILPEIQLQEVINIWSSLWAQILTQFSTSTIVPLTNKGSRTNLGLVTANNRCRDNFIYVLLFIYNSFQIYCCNNHWRNLLWWRWHLYVFWRVNSHLKFAPAHLCKL